MIATIVACSCIMLVHEEVCVVSVESEVVESETGFHHFYCTSY